MDLSINNNRVNMEPISLGRVAKAKSNNGKSNSCGRFLKACALKVTEATKFTLKALVGIALYALNPVPFTVGFFVGLLITDKVKETVDKILNFMKKMPWQTALLVGVAGALSMPITLAAGAFIYGSWLSIKLIEKLN